MAAIRAPLPQNAGGIFLPQRAPCHHGVYNQGMPRLTNRILVLHGGPLLEAGPHHQLLASGSRDARFFAAEAQWYR